MIPVDGRILRREIGDLVVEALISEKQYEYPERRKLLCPNGHAFAIPAGVELLYV